MDNRKELTNQKIRDAYVTELTEHPDYSPSIKAICITSNINRTTFYRYYESIDDLEVHLIVEGLEGFIDKFLANGNIFEEPEKYFEAIRENRIIEDNLLFKILRARGDAPLPPEAIDKVMSSCEKSMGDKFDRYKLAFALSGGLGVIFLDNRAKSRSGRRPPRLGDVPPTPPADPDEKAKGIIDRLCQFYRALKDI